MINFTLREKLIDRATNGALTKWCSAIEEAIGSVPPLEENQKLGWLVIEANPEVSEKKVVQEPCEINENIIDIAVYLPGLPLLESRQLVQALKAFMSRQDLEFDDDHDGCIIKLPNDGMVD